MAKLPQVSGKDVGRALTRLGFVLKSQRGSHMKFVKEDDFGRCVIIVPAHDTIRPGTLYGILKQVNISVDRFKKLI